LGPDRALFIGVFAWVLCVLGVQSFVSPAFAQVKVNIEVAGECADAEAIREAVQARVPWEATVSISVTCTPDITVRIAIDARDIAEERTLSIAPEELAELSDAITIVVLVALDSRFEDEDEAPEPEDDHDTENAEPAATAPTPGVEVEPAQPEQVIARAPMVPPDHWAGAEFRFGVIVGGGAHVDVLPGLLVGGAYRFTPAFSLGIDFLAWARQRFDFDPHGQVDLFLGSFRIAPCFVGSIPVDRRLAFEVGACPALSIGAAGARAREFAGENLERWEPWVATSLRLRGAIEFERLILGLEAEAGANLVTPTFYVLVDGTSRVFVEHSGTFFLGIALVLGGRWSL
jgi:hypothetical protein